MVMRIDLDDSHNDEDYRTDNNEETVGLRNSDNSDDEDDDIDRPGRLLVESSSSSSLWVSWWKHHFTLREVSGSCGDFGTLIPLLVALARERCIYLAPTLLGTGIVHILTGLYWDIPMPLQPMKSIAALAIAQQLTRMQVTTAGVGMGICFLFLTLGGINVLHRWIPHAVIGGL